MKEFIFFREEGFYVVPLLYGTKKDIADNVKCNPGTIKVTALNGDIVWPEVAHKTNKKINCVATDKCQINFETVNK